MHWVVREIEKRFPDVLSFANDVSSVNKAASVSLVNLETDSAMLQRAVTAVKEELSHNATHPSLLAFMRDVLPKVERAIKAVKEADSLFRRATLYFGEESSMEPATFFSTFQRLVSSFDQARTELRIQERKAEEADKSPASLEHHGGSKRLRLRGLTRHASQTDGPELREEVEDGAIDEIISEMKTSAYRRPDAGYKRDKREVGQVDESVSYANARPWLK